MLQTEPEYIVKLHFDQTKFPCTGQYVRARDGDSLSAELLADIAFDKNPPISGTIYSTEQSLLLEFFSDEMVVARSSCVGGFLAHATTFRKYTHISSKKKKNIEIQFTYLYFYISSIQLPFFSFSSFIPSFLFLFFSFFFFFN